MVNCNPTRARNPTEPCGRGCRAIGTCKSNVAHARAAGAAVKQCKPGKTRPCGRGCRALNKPCKIDGTPGVIPGDAAPVASVPVRRRTEAEYQALLRKALRISKEQKRRNQLVSILGMAANPQRQREFDIAYARSFGLPIVDPHPVPRTDWDIAVTAARVKPGSNRKQRGVL